MHLERKRSSARVRITNEMLRDFSTRILKGDIATFAKKKGLPYLFVYNFAHNRIKTISGDQYETIFGKKAPEKNIKRVEGTRFRAMARAWLFLHGETTIKDLYRELHSNGSTGEPDYRIFTGQVKTVDIELERAMERKFLNEGFKKPEIDEIVHNSQKIDFKKRVAWEKIKPTLHFLERTLKVSPSRLLRRQVTLYESGALKTISAGRYRRVQRLKEKAHRALYSGSRFELEKLREEIYGERKGMTLFSEIEEQLDVLQKYFKKSAKGYLGRSVSSYKKSRLSRIAAWRADRIKREYAQLTTRKTDIPIAVLPKSQLPESVSKLLGVLNLLMLEKLSVDHGEAFEKGVLMPPTSSIGESGKAATGGFTGMDRAADVLGMTKKAFDLMVGHHRDLFGKVVHYNGTWSLPNSYLHGIKRKRGFSLIKTKYEQLAKQDH